MNFLFINYFLIGVLCLSVYYDYTKRIIPNKLTMPAIIIGVLWSTINSGFGGFLFSVLGFLFGFTVFFIPYVLGGIGAGDVKLMAAIGSLMGWKFTLASSVFTAIAGGIFVIMYLVIKGGIRQTLIDTIGLLIKPISIFLYMTTGKEWFLKKQKYFINQKAKGSNDHIPYAFAISAGTLFVLFYGVDRVIQF